MNNILSWQSVRFNDISILRVSAMLMVVLYHCLCPYSIWDHTDYYIGFHVYAWDVVDGMLAQIHLPIFFIISGYLYGYKRIRGGYSKTRVFVYKKYERVLLPYLIVGLFLCLLQQRNVVQLLNGISHLWFLLVIFECYLLGRTLDKALQMGDKKQLLLISFAVLLVICLSYRMPSVKIFGLWGLIKYFPYYIIGMLLCRIEFNQFAKYKTFILLGSIGLILSLGVQQVSFKSSLLSSVLGLSIVVLSFSYMRTLQINKIPRWLISLDKCSMGIYIVHHIVIQEMNAYNPFHAWAIDYKYIYPIVQFILVTLASWLFVSVCQNSKYSKYVLG